ncbi:MAG: hypothetical protein KJ792_04840 [Actinobacteria bacterium]|nr:hypothetical protein [Actinomycetota bacterium]MCG2801828.1 hypothetical protein [Cellulomonas sp.]
MTNDRIDSHEATLVAAEHRVASRVLLDEVQRGALAAVRRHSPTLAPRVAEVLRADEAARARRERTENERATAEPRTALADERRRERRDFIDHGIVR